MDRPVVSIFIACVRRSVLQRCIAVLALGSCLAAFGSTRNGNDFALYFSEATQARDRAALLEDAVGNAHFFRYLQIMEMREVQVDGRPRIDIIAFEPSSLMDVAFSVTRSISQKKIKEEPESKQGDALAVTGKVSGVDAQNRIRLDSVIVRHKDRLSPAVGKELLFEVSDSAVFYSFTGGKRTVSLTYKDRDLLQGMKQKKEALGADGWAEYLERELAKREQARAAKKAAGGAGR